VLDGREDFGAWRRHVPCSCGRAGSKSLEPQQGQPIMKRTRFIAVPALALSLSLVTGCALDSEETDEPTLAEEDSEIAVNYSGRNLQGQNFSGLELNFSNFDSSNVGSAWFINTLCYGCTFTRAAGTSANFTNAYLPFASFYAAATTYAHFDGANLYAASFYAAASVFSYFVGANLRSADFTGASLYGSNLQYADLRGASFYGADLRFTNLCNTLHDPGAFLHANTAGALCATP
jgi:uncharacterized protein YjbI with pentapeptide repeats